MPEIKDMPDNYAWLPGSGRYPMVDLGELAARLGSPYAFDRRGTVVWLDNFTNGLGPWRVSGSGTGNAVTLVTTDTYRGPAAAELKAGSDGSTLSQIGRNISPMVAGRMGALAGISMSTACQHFRIAIHRYHDTTRTEGILFIRDTEQDLAIRDENNNTVSIAAIGEPVFVSKHYHEVKLVVDFVTNDYVRIIFNDTEYDISEYPLYETTTTEVPFYYVTLRLTGNAGDNDLAQVSHMVVTVGEP